MKTKLVNAIQKYFQSKIDWKLRNNSIYTKRKTR
jgi:hypothetical protein